MLKKISILTLFPESIHNYFNSSIMKKAIKSKKIDIEIIDFRKYSKDKHLKVDDTPYGGGPGMVLQIEPLYNCLKEIKTNNSYTILTSASGYLYNQNTAKQISKIKKEHIIIICGHYEGVDERIENYIDTSICIGDYILTGGELASLIICDSIIRIMDDVISEDSIKNESFEDELLDYPVYTKPYEFNNLKVPDVLLSGNHKKIEEFRKNQRILKTKKYRPDMYNKFKTKKEN